MNPETVPMIVYIISTTITPGPNNITSATAGINLGMKKSLPYLSGISAGFFIVMLFSGYSNLFLQSHYNSAAIYIKWAGFIYMIWLCISLFLKTGRNGAVLIPFSFKSGMLFQLVNPKVIIYGLTLYGLFPGILLKNFRMIFFSSLCLAATGFAAVLLWCMAGASLNRFLTNKRNRMIMNIILSILLIYTGFSILTS